MFDIFVIHNMHKRSQSQQHDFGLKLFIDRPKFTKHNHYHLTHTHSFAALSIAFVWMAI